MKQKILSLFFLTAILSLTFVSAATFTITTTTPADLTKSRTNTSFLITPNLQNSTTINIAVTLPQQINDSKGNVINLNSPFVIPPFTGISNGQTQGPVPISYAAGTVPANFIIGKYTVNAIITAIDTANTNNTLTQNVPINFINDFCNNGENGTDLSISRVDINNEDGDDTEWKPLDSIIVKVEVSNDGTERVKEVFVELGLIDSDGKNIIKNMDDLTNRKISIGSISDGKDSTKEFRFKVPFDFNEENYKLVVKAYSDDVGQKNLCTAHSSDLDNNFYNLISGTRETDENKQVIVTNTILSPELGQCGDKIQLSGEVANIGDTDYEDKVKITLFNKELGINSFDEISTDLEQGDSSPFSFDFDISATAAEKTYTLEMRTYYDYDTGDNTYNLDSDETFTKVIKVQGNCKTTSTIPTIAEPAISAELDSSTPEAIAGKDVLIVATIRNNDKKDVTYTVSVSDNTGWSSLVSVEPKTITIPAGQSSDATITLKIDNDAQGDNDFTIKATYGDNLVKQYRGSVTVTKSQAALDSIAKHFQNNWYIYLIVLVNLILIIAIIAVIRKMIKPRKA